MNAETRALSGRTVDDLTLGAVRVGEAGLADLRIHPETLERQAVIAKQLELERAPPSDRVPATHDIPALWRQAEREGIFRQA